MKTILKTFNLFSFVYNLLTKRKKIQNPQIEDFVSCSNLLCIKLNVIAPSALPNNIPIKYKNIFNENFFAKTKYAKFAILCSNPANKNITTDKMTINTLIILSSIFLYPSTAVNIKIPQKKDSINVSCHNLLLNLSSTCSKAIPVILVPFAIKIKLPVIIIPIILPNNVFKIIFNEPSL